MKKIVIFPTLVLVFVMIFSLTVAYTVSAASPSAKASTADRKTFEVPVGQTVTKSIVVTISNGSFRGPSFYDTISEIYVEASNDNVVNVTKTSVSGDGLSSKNTVITFGLTVKGNKAGSSSIKVTISGGALASSSSDISATIPIVVKDSVPVTMKAGFASGVSSDITVNQTQTKGVVVTLENGTFTGNADAVLKAIEVSASNGNIKNVAKSGSPKLSGNNQLSFSVSIAGSAAGSSSVKVTVPSSVTTASGGLSSSIAVTVKGTPPVQAAPAAIINVDSYKVNVGETAKNTVRVTLTNGESIRSGVTPAQLLNAISISGNNKNISSNVVLSNCQITDSTHFRFDMAITGKAAGAASTRYLSQAVINRNVLTLSSSNLALPQLISVTVVAPAAKPEPKTNVQTNTTPKQEEVVPEPEATAALTLGDGGYGVMYKGDTRSNKVTVTLTNAKLKSGITAESLLSAVTVTTDNVIASNPTKANAVVVSDNTFTFDLGITAAKGGKGTVSVKIDASVLTTGKPVETPKAAIDIKTEIVLSQADFSIASSEIELSEAFKAVNKPVVTVSNAKINSLEAIALEVPEGLAKYIENPTCTLKDGSITVEISLKQGIEPTPSKITGNIGLTFKKEGITPNQGYVATEDIKKSISVTIIPSVAVSASSASIEITKEKVAVSKVKLINASFATDFKVVDVSVPTFSGNLASFINVSVTELNENGFQVNIRLGNEFPLVPAEGIEGKISILIQQNQIVPNEGVLSYNILAEIPIKLTNQDEVNKVAAAKNAEAALFANTLSIDSSKDKTSGAITATYNDKAAAAIAERLKTPDYATISPVIKINKFDTKQLTFKIPQKHFSNLQLFTEMTVSMEETALSINTMLFNTSTSFENIEFKVTATDKTNSLAMNSISNKRPIYIFGINTDDVPMQEIAFRNKIKASIKYKAAANENVGVMLINDKDVITLIDSVYNGDTGLFTFNLNRLGTYFIGNIDVYESFKTNAVTVKPPANTPKPAQTEPEQPVVPLDITPLVESKDVGGSEIINLDQNNLSIIKLTNMNSADPSIAKITLDKSLLNLIVPSASIHDVKSFSKINISLQECTLNVPTTIFDENIVFSEVKVNVEKIKEPSVLAHKSLSNGRPVYNFILTADGNPMTNQVRLYPIDVSIKYTKNANETDKIKVGVFYTDGSGKLTFLNSTYDDVTKTFNFKLVGNGTYFIGNSDAYE